jgi:hypothetical protein
MRRQVKSIARQAQLAARHPPSPTPARSFAATVHLALPRRQPPDGTGRLNTRAQAPAVPPGASPTPAAQIHSDEPANQLSERYSAPPPEDPPKGNDEAEQSTQTPPASLSLENVHGILWSPTHDPPLSTPSLPPDYILEDALTNLLVTLQPQTQSRAAYPSSDGPPTEPTLALYCPIEGGDYVVDNTVREIARKAGADVVVLDAAHIAANESGKFGKGESFIVVTMSNANPSD